MSLQEIATLVGAAKSTTSVALRRIEALGGVRRTRRPGDRRDFYEAVWDPVTLVAHWLRRFLLPDLAEGQAVAQNLAGALAAVTEGLDATDAQRLQERADAFAQVVARSSQFFSSLLTESGAPDRDIIRALILGAAPPEET